MLLLHEKNRGTKTGTNVYRAYDENQKRIEKEENINIEYNFREVFLFLLSIDVAMEYEKIHVIRMANI